MKSTKTGKRRRAVIFSAFFLIAVVAAFWAVPALEKTDLTSVPGSGDWMKDISDSTPLNMITLPGTHCSASFHVQPAFFSRCQNRSISEQLNDGFRYLDIHLGIESGSDSVLLKLMHGSATCRKKASLSSGKLYLDNVLAQCYAFLDLHPYEAIIFSVTMETGEGSISDFEKLLLSYVSQDPEYWLLTDEVPTIGEARGKLVLARRYEDEAGLGTEAGMPLLWKDQSGFGNPDLSFEENVSENIRLWVQDRYEFDNDEKWLAFITTLGTCPADYENGDICINHLSTNGSISCGHPFSHAARLNSEFLEISLNPGVAYGWIIADFGTPALAQNIYSCNFVS